MPAFKLELDDLPAESLELLAQWWEEARTGNPPAKSVTVKIQSITSQTPDDALTITMAGSHIVGLNDSVVATPYIVIEPGLMRVQAHSMNLTRYLAVDLPALTTPEFAFGFEPDVLLLHRSSGGG